MEKVVGSGRDTLLTFLARRRPKQHLNRQGFRQEALGVGCGDAHAETGVGLGGRAGSIAKELSHPTYRPLQHVSHRKAVAAVRRMLRVQASSTNLANRRPIQGWAKGWKIGRKMAGRRWLMNQSSDHQEARATPPLAKPARNVPRPSWSKNGPGILLCPMMSATSPPKEAGQQRPRQRMKA